MPIVKRRHTAGRRRTSGERRCGIDTDTPAASALPARVSRRSLAFEERPPEHLAGVVSFIALALVLRDENLHQTLTRLA